MFLLSELIGREGSRDVGDIVTVAIATEVKSEYLVRTHHGDAEIFKLYFILVSDRHCTHIFHILLMVICLYTDIIS